jgi:hypothetical protein
LLIAFVTYYGASIIQTHFHPNSLRFFERTHRMLAYLLAESSTTLVL